MARGKQVAEVQFSTIKTASASFTILGKTPLVYNAMSEKARMELLNGGHRKTSAEKATTLKHDPFAEYRNSVYRLRNGEEGSTRLLAPSRWFKGAMAEVAKRVVGSSTAEMKQLVWVEGDMNPLYGVPQLFMSVVRNAGINSTPDIRTRAIVPQWYCVVTINFVQPNITSQALFTLLSSAGVLNGVGDFRQQKGAGNYGQFEVVRDDDKRISALRKIGAMKAQDAALKNPQPYDQETEQMLSWHLDHLRKRDMTRDEEDYDEAAE